MKIAAIISFLLSSQVAFACLSLNGNLRGQCTYRSQSWGDLEGEIEFSIQQNACHKIVIDGTNLNIPGSVRQEVKDNDTLDQVDLAVRWENESMQRLGFDYERKVIRSGRIVDDIQLKGYFGRNSSGLVLYQKGLVDRDPVEIKCFFD